MTGAGDPVSKLRGHQYNIIVISYTVVIVIVSFVTLSPLGSLAKFQRDWGSVGVAQRWEVSCVHQVQTGRQLRASFCQ